MSTPSAGAVAWLFCPADRPERYAKAAAAGDVVILDLEDGVAPDNRRTAREALIAHPLAPERTVVRINPAGTKDHLSDLTALRETEYTRVMLAKTESAAQVAALAPLQVLALCETPRGVLNALEIAEARNVVGLMWGAEDLIVGLGGDSNRFPDGRYRDVVRHARSTVLLAAGATGKLAIDSVYLDIHDHDGLAAESADAAHVGFGAKASIHPGQMDVIRHAYRPEPDQVAWAERVLAAAQGAFGAFALEGRMIDEPVLRQARAILARS
jgi:citrate lyase subunit beta/citryl-CoA lyase